MIDEEVGGVKETSSRVGRDTKESIPNKMHEAHIFT